MGRPRKVTENPAEARKLERIRKASAARHAAYNRMRETFPDEWEKFYAEEAAKVGVTPQVSRYANRKAELLAELERLEALQRKARGRIAPKPQVSSKGSRRGR